MITILNRRHVALLFRHLREARHLTRQEVAARLFVSTKTVANRERFDKGVNTEVLLDTARVLGYDIALIPARRPGARPTGTGWPT